MAKLEKYKKKRDFKKTSEPQGEEGIRNLARPIYLIQKHKASHLHFDLRLEIDGALKSWAVPKEPSSDPKIKRLAVHVEDHPLAYAAFHGTIPEGEYGAGTVEIWDRGTFENIKEKSLESQYHDGQLEIDLKGKKLKGPYVLVKTGAGKNWLFKKMLEQDGD